jgi:hypothetical protein
VRLPYASPTAFRRALTDRLRAVAKPRGTWPLADLQRQFAYDRLLARLYQHDSGWVVKGATALLARDIGARHTVDLDVYRAAARDEAEQALREAARIDLGDWFVFELGPGHPVADGGKGTRLPVTARIGTVEWARFHVDVVADSIRMTGTPDKVPPLTPVTIPGLDRPGYRAYPLVDHIADKVCAILERHGDARRPSTRFKDLVDLVALAAAVDVTAAQQRHALVSEANRRGLQLPDRFDVPDRSLWGPGYAAEAARAPHSPAATLDDALAIVRAFIDPLLDDRATGAWDPSQQAWQH